MEQSLNFCSQCGTRLTGGGLCPSCEATRLDLTKPRAASTPVPAPPAPSYVPAAPPSADGAAWAHPSRFPPPTPSARVGPAEDRGTGAVALTQVAAGMAVFFAIQRFTYLVLALVRRDGGAISW